MSRIDFIFKYIKENFSKRPYKIIEYDKQYYEVHFGDDKNMDTIVVLNNSGKILGYNPTVIPIELYKRGGLIHKFTE